jgi:hypothetical protein
MPDPGLAILAPCRTPSLPAVFGAGGGFLRAGERTVELRPENRKFFRRYLLSAVGANQLCFLSGHISSCQRITQPDKKVKKF